MLPGMLHGAILRSPLAHAKITSVDASTARAHPLVAEVLTGADLAERGLAWMPPCSGRAGGAGHRQGALPGQEIAFVVAADRYAARDALELISVDYEPLPPLVDASAALHPDAPAVRDDRPGGNHISDWNTGDTAATDAVFATADVVVSGDFTYPRPHPAPLETCGAIADYDPVEGRLTVWSTSQAPHAHRTLYTALTQIPEHKIRVISPDLGGGFGSKVPVYPGYVCALAASMTTGRRVQRGRAAAKFPAGFFHIFTGSYQTQAAYCEVTGVFTNKAPGGVACSCSFRITEAVYLVERLTDMLAREPGADPAELRMRNLLRPEQFPCTTPSGWTYDSGDYPVIDALAPFGVTHADMPLNPGTVWLAIQAASRKEDT